MTDLMCQRCWEGDPAELAVTTFDDEVPTIEAADAGDLVLIHMACLGSEVPQ